MSAHLSNYPPGFTQGMHDDIFADGEGSCDECGEPDETLYAYETPLGKNAVTVRNVCWHCAPKCAVHPDRLMHPESEGCCAPCEIEMALEAIAEHNNDRPKVMTYEWQTKGAILEARYHIWRARRAA